MNTNSHLIIEGKKVAKVALLLSNINKSSHYLYSCLNLFKIYKTHVYIVKRFSLISSLAKTKP